MNRRKMKTGTLKAEQAKRILEKRRYAVAFIITLGIFLLGLFLGLVIEGKRVQYIDSLGKEQALDYDSLQVQYAFLDQLTEERDCKSMLASFDTYLKAMEKTRIRLETYDEDSTINKEDFNLLKRKYIIAQIRYYLLSKKFREICDVEQARILYFYSTRKECPLCEEQAFVLTYLKKILKDHILIFSIDGNLENEPMVTILKNTYGIDKYPSLIIERNRFDYFANKETILNEICPYYDNISIKECG